MSVLHTVRSIASSYSVHCPVITWTLCISYLRLPPRLPVTFSLHLPSNNVFYKTVPTPAVTNPVTFPSFHCLYDILFPPWPYVTFTISHTIGPTDLLHLSPAPHFKNLISISDPLSELSKFQHHTHTQSQLCSKCRTLLVSSLNISPICWWKEPHWTVR